MSHCNQPQAHPERCGCGAPGTQQVSSVWLAQLRAEYLQFGEECEKLKARNNTLDNRLSNSEFNSAQLLTRLAALTDLTDGWEKNWFAVVDSIEKASLPTKRADHTEPLFWALYDATTNVPYFKKLLPENCLAIFDSEAEAQRAKVRNKGTDYKGVYITATKPVFTGVPADDE
jgi:hypothetical protein